MRALIVANPASGKGRAIDVVSRVTAELSIRGVNSETVLEPSLAQSLEKVSILNATNSFDVLICIGGDGLIHHLLEPLTKNNLPLLIIPQGSGNDCARSLGLNRLSPSQLLELIFANSSQEIDLGLVTSKTTSKLFFQIASTGFDAQVSHIANGFTRIPPSLKYLVATLRSAPKARAIKYVVTHQGKVTECESMLMLVANGANYGRGMKIAPHADNRDGVLHLMRVDTVSWLRLLLVFPRVFIGSHVRHPKVHFTDIQSSDEITLEAATALYADGEWVTQLPATVRLAPVKLKVFCA